MPAARQASPNGLPGPREIGPPSTADGCHRTRERRPRTPPGRKGNPAMHPYAITDTPPALTGPQAAPGATHLPARVNRARPGPAKPDTSLILGAVDTPPADARATLRLTLKVCGLPHLTNPAAVICTELVTNAITASRDKAPPRTPPCHVTLRLT